MSYIEKITSLNGVLFIAFSGDAKYTFPPGKEPLGKINLNHGKKLLLIRFQNIRSSN